MSVGRNGIRLFIWRGLVVVVTGWEESGVEEVPFGRRVTAGAIEIVFNCEMETYSGDGMAMMWLLGLFDVFSKNMDKLVG